MRQGRGSLGGGSSSAAPGDVRRAQPTLSRAPGKTGGASLWPLQTAFPETGGAGDARALGSASPCPRPRPPGALTPSSLCSSWPPMGTTLRGTRTSPKCLPSTTGPRFLTVSKSQGAWAGIGRTHQAGQRLPPGSWGGRPGPWGLAVGWWPVAGGRAVGPSLWVSAGVSRASCAPRWSEEDAEQLRAASTPGQAPRLPALLDLPESPPSLGVTPQDASSLCAPSTGLAP